MTKTFLSIGSGPGIGLNTAVRFAKEGYRVVLSARNTERLRATAASLSDAGYDVAFQAVDVTDPGSVSNLVARIGADLDVLHYNAGVLHYDPQGVLLTRTIGDETNASLVSDTQINIAGAMIAIKAAMPAFTVRKAGTVLLTGGGLGLEPSGDFLTLSVGKAGLRAVGQALFEPFKEMGVHVALVSVSRLVSPASEHAVNIAEIFWRLHSEVAGAWTFEEIYR